ncbi:DJ-1/PfpI family protein [Aquimarina sediminis]|uniref:DJ-1/PfpI family protein n=1 Tax=Aquimarina sediminis TaxID=2070536 RepID=UPI000CA00F98|nr:DJ-1/PfpI family protein [Aquimarina sediminis]
MKATIITLSISLITLSSCQKQNHTIGNSIENTLETKSNKDQVSNLKKEYNLKPDGTSYTDAELDAISHTELMMMIHEPPRDTIQTVGILLYDGYFSLDAMGPLSVLSHMSPTKTILVGRKKGIIASSSNVKTQVDYSIEDIDQLDILIIPGGFVETYKATQDKELLAWVQKIDKKSKYTVSVCTGAWILGAAGLLNGKEATTHWYKAKEKLANYGAKYVNKRYTNDGKYWTSAGVSAGIDMSLALIDHILGRNYAAFTALDIEYDPEPPFQGGNPNKTDRVVTYMLEKMYDLGLEPYLNKN